MARLFVLGGPDAGALHEVTGAVGLGRSPSCEVRLRHPSVSRRHAELVPDGDSWIVNDLDSRNGLRFGGRRVKRARLEDGDEFVLGELPLRLRFTADESARAGGGASAVAERPVAPAVPASPQVEDLGEDLGAVGLELEGEEFLSATGSFPVGAVLRPDGPATANRDAAGETPDTPELDERARLIFEMQRKSRGGVLSADLAQRAWPIRMALYLIGAGVALALAYGAYLGVLGLRG